MQFFKRDEVGTVLPLQESLTFAQNKQATAVMDAIGRLIPQEGVDYDVHIIFKGGVYDPSVSIEVEAHTDKGKFWKDYISEMLPRYPPVVDYNGEILPDTAEIIEKKPEKEKENEQEH